MLLSGWQQALTVLLTVVPGFVYQGSRAHFRGPTPDEREIGVRILRALALSGIFALLYVVIFGSHLTSGFLDKNSYLSNPRASAIWGFLMLFVVPFISAAAIHVWSSRKQYPDLAWRKRFRVYDPTPSAWDFASARLEPGFVRILTKDGLWIGGYAGEGSFFTGYPEPREIYLEEAWTLGNDGTFDGIVSASRGMWVRCDDAQLVQFLGAGEPSSDPPPSQDPAPSP